MKSISGALTTHIGQDTTSLASCWRITRQDGVNFYFTTHDVDIVYLGNTYLSAVGFSRTAVANNSSLSVDNLDIEGIFDDASIKEDELRAGLFDYAEVRIFLVNWADLSQGEIKARRGWLGEVVATPQGTFKAELRGLTQVIQQTIGQVYSAECRADLGDTRCKVPLNPSLRINSTFYAKGTFVRYATDTGALGQAQFENRIYECTTAGTTAASPPTFDETVGSTTIDGGAFAEANLAFTGVPSNGQQVTIGTRTYTFQTTLTNVNGNVLIGADANACRNNLKNAINLGPGSGTVYAAATVIHPLVSAFDGVGSGDMIARAKTRGVAGNDIEVSETLSNASWSETDLVGGVDGVVWTAREAWSRHATVSAVTSKSVFNITVTDSRAVDDWFNGGVLTFESGPNNGRSMEVKDWVQSSGTVTLFLGVGYLPTVGDRLRLYPGCDKRTATCNARFANIINFRGEPHVPGRDAVMEYPNAKS